MSRPERNPAMEEAFLRLPPQVLDTQLGRTIFKVALRHAEAKPKPRTARVPSTPQPR